MSDRPSDRGVPQDLRAAAAIVQNGYVVRNLETAIAAWNRVTGAGPFFVKDNADAPHFTYRGLPNTARLRTALSQLGNVQLELIEQTNDAPSIFREILDARGEGLHHIKLAHSDYAETLRYYEHRGFPVAFQGEVPGLMRFTFFDALASLGHFIEFSETEGVLADRDLRIAEACRTWTGQDLIRDVESLVQASPS